MSISKWNVCKPCCDDGDDLFNIVVYDCNTGNLLYYIDCDIDPYGFSIDENNNFIVVGKKVFYNFCIRDKPDKFRMRIAYGATGVIKYLNTSFDTSLLWGQIINRIDQKYLIIGNAASPTTQEIKVLGQPTIGFRNLDTSKLLPPTTVTINNTYTGIGYRDALAVSGKYILFNKFGDETIYENRNPVQLFNQKNNKSISDGFSLTPNITNPVLTIKFSGLTTAGESVNKEKQINISTGESLASVLNKLNAIDSRILFTTTQTQTIENGIIDFDYQFDGNSIINVTVNSGSMMRGSKELNKTVLYFKLTQQEWARVINGEKIIIQLLSGTIEIVYVEEVLLSRSNNSNYGVNTFLQKDNNERWYVTLTGVSHIIKAGLRIGNDPQHVFADDYSYERYKIFDASNCIYHLFYQNNSQGNYRVSFDRPYNFSTGFLNANNTYSNSYIETSVFSYGYRYITYLDYFEQFKVDMDFPEPSIQFKPFGKVENSTLNLKGTHIEGGGFTDLLHHSSGRVYALGYNPNIMIERPIPIYQDATDGHVFIDTAFMYSPGGLDISNSKSPANIFELDADTLEIKKAVLLNNWALAYSSTSGPFYGLYWHGGLREINNQIWIGNIAYSVDLDYVSHNWDIGYDDMVDNQGKLAILIGDVLASVSYSGVCSWAYNLKIGLNDSSFYYTALNSKKTNGQVRHCIDSSLLGGGGPRYFAPEEWSIEGCRSKKLTVDNLGNIYVLDYYNFNVIKFSQAGDLLATMRDPYRENANLLNDISLLIKDDKIYTITSRQQRKRRLPVVKLNLSDSISFSESATK